MQEKIKQIKAARELTRTVKVAQAAEANILGSEVNMGSVIQDIPKISPLSFTLDNSAGTTTKNFLIGDPTGIIADAIGGTVAAPDKLNGSASLVSPNKEMLKSVSILFNKMNIQTSTDASQFEQTPVIYTANMIGDVVPKRINLAAAKRNTAQDGKLLTLNVEMRLDTFRGLYLPVIAGEKVVITLTPSAYTS